PDLHYTVSVVGGDVAVRDFGNYQPATIRGLKFLDRDGDGTRDEDEPGLEGWTIFLDQNQNGALDAGESSATTGTDGTYEFTGLTPGTYFIAEVPQEGWVQTLPGNAPLSSADESPILLGDSRLVIDAHHADPGHSSSPFTHFFRETGDEHH